MTEPTEPTEPPTTTKTYDGSRICSIEGCERPYCARGWCGRHYQIWKKHGDPLYLQSSDRRVILKRLFAKFTVGDECWLWTAGLNAYGYGSFRVAGRGVPAHRFIYEWLVGPIPEGLELDHLCRVRNCVRPDHLEPVTHAENLRRGRGVSSINASKTHCPQGHEYTEANTYRDPRSSKRICRECRQERVQNRRGHSRISGPNGVPQ